MKLKILILGKKAKIPNLVSDITQNAHSMTVDNVSLVKNAESNTTILFVWIQIVTKTASLDTLESVSSKQSVNSLLRMYVLISMLLLPVVTVT